MARSRRDDDDEDDDDRPRKKSRSRRDEEEDDEDDTPRRKKRASRDDDEDDDQPVRKKSRARDDEEDDDDDEDDRPRKKRNAGKRSKKASGGSGPLLLILGLVGGVVLLLGGGGVAAFFLFFNDTPEKAFDDLKDAVLKKDYGRMYDRMDRDAQQDMVKSAEFMVQFDKSLAAHSGKKGKELYIAVNKEMESKVAGQGGFSDKMREDIKNSKVEKVVVDGDTATLTIKTGDGRTDTGKMVKQDGRWRVKKK